MLNQNKTENILTEKDYSFEKNFSTSELFLLSGTVILIASWFGLLLRELMTLSSFSLLGLLLSATGFLVFLDIMTRQQGEDKPYKLINAFLYTASGLFIVINPDMSAQWFQLALSLVFLTAGSLRLLIVFKHRKTITMTGMMTSGFLALLLGLLIFLGWHHINQSFIGILIGTEIAIQGSALIALGLSDKTDKINH